MGVIKNTLVGILGLAVFGGAVAFGVPQFRKKIVDEIAKTSDIYKTSQSNNADLTKKQEDTTTELGQKINDLKETNDKLDSANASIKSKESQIADLQTKNTTLTSELNTKQTELTALQSKYDIDIDKLNADISKLIGEKTTLQSQYDEEVAKYNTDTRSLQAQINSKQNEPESVNAQPTQVKSEKTALENQVTQLTSDKSLLQTQITDLQAQITALSNSSGITPLKSVVRYDFSNSSGQRISCDFLNVNFKDFIDAYSSESAYSVISLPASTVSFTYSAPTVIGSCLKSVTSDLSSIDVNDFTLIGFSYNNQFASYDFSNFIASYSSKEYTLNKKCYLNADLVTDYSSLSDDISYSLSASIEVVDKNINLNFYVNSFDYILKFDDNNYFDFLNKKISIDGKILSIDKFNIQFQAAPSSGGTFSPFLLIDTGSFFIQIDIKTRTVVYNGKTFKLVSSLADPVVFEFKSGTYIGSYGMIFDTTAKTVTFNGTTYNYTQTDNIITVDGQFTAQLNGDNHIVFLTGLSGSERLIA